MSSGEGGAVLVPWALRGGIRPADRTRFNADFFSNAYHQTYREVILMTTVAATSYVGAVLAGLSGIVAVLSLIHI